MPHPTPPAATTLTAPAVPGSPFDTFAEDYDRFTALWNRLDTTFTSWLTDQLTLPGVTGEAGGSGGRWTWAAAPAG